MLLIKKAYNHLFFIVLTTYLILDIINKYGIIYENDTLTGISLIIKVSLLFLLFIIIITSKNRVVYEILTGMIVLCGIFVLGQFFLNHNPSNLVHQIILNLKVFYWYVHIFFITAFIYSINSELLRNNINDVVAKIDVLVIIQAVIALIALIMDYSLFSSYGKNRFGINGIFINTTQANYIYIILILLYDYKLKTNYNIKNFILISLLVLLSSLLGTKSILLFNFIYLMYSLLKASKKFIFNVHIKIVLFSIICIAFFCSLFFTFNTDLFQGVLKEKGLLNMLTSQRYELFMDSFIPFISTKWSLMNYLVGGANFYINRTEFEFVDFFWFFGIIGSIFYFLLLNKYLFKIKILLRSPLFFLTIIFCLSGSFFSSITTIFFFIIFIIFTNSSVINFKNESNQI